MHPVLRTPTTTLSSYPVPFLVSESGFSFVSRTLPETGKTIRHRLLPLEVKHVVR